MSQTIQSNPAALVESIARKLPASCADDFRNLMNETVLANLTALSPGGNLLQIGGVKPGSSAPPVGVTHNVQGANTQLSVNISNPSNTPPGQAIWHEFSYSPLKSFVSNSTTTLEPTTATSFQVPAVGQSVYCRLRSSYDKVNWSNYQLSSSDPIDAGYLSSAATSPAGAFNQTNFATVDYSNAGNVTTVTVNGTGGMFTPYTAVKGSVQSSRPSATIVGIDDSNSQFLGWDGEQFQLSPTLVGAFADGLEPVGAVIAGAGTPGGGGVSGGNGGRMTAV